MALHDFLNEFKSKYPTAEVVVTEAFGETTLKVDKSQLHNLLGGLRNSPAMSYDVLIDLTAVDYLEPHKHTKIVYWLQNLETNARIRVVTDLTRQEPLQSVTSLWRGADWYERELFDLFGVIIEGHPDIKRILMPDDWQGHPLRKDYALTEESVEFKHGVKPKVPSEIIPYVKQQTVT